MREHYGASGRINVGINRDRAFGQERSGSCQPFRCRRSVAQTSATGSGTPTDADIIADVSVAKSLPFPRHPTRADVTERSKLS